MTEARRRFQMAGIDLAREMDARWQEFCAASTGLEEHEDLVYAIPLISELAWVFNSVAQDAERVAGAWIDRVAAENRYFEHRVLGDLDRLDEAA